MKEIIDLESWQRASVFHSYKNGEMPYTNICTDVDITEFMRYIRTYNYQFYASLLFYVTKASNIIESFRCRIEDGVPVRWDKIAAGYSLMTYEDIFGTACTEFSEDFKTFYENALSDINVAKEGGDASHKLNGKRLDVIYITSVPWVNLTSFYQAIPSSKQAMPFIGIGRRFGSGDRVKISINVQAHHSFVDGYHIAQFFKLLEIMFASPESYIDDQISRDELLQKSKPFILSKEENPIFQAF